MKGYRHLRPVERQIIRLLWARCSVWDSPYGWNRWLLACRFGVGETCIDNILRGRKRR